MMMVSWQGRAIIADGADITHFSNSTISIYFSLNLFGKDRFNKHLSPS